MDWFKNQLIHTQWCVQIFCTAAGPKLRAGFILPPVYGTYNQKYYDKNENYKKFINTPKSAPHVTDKPIDNGTEPFKSLRFLSIDA